MSPRRLPKYCSEFRDRHGRMRVRFRRKGFETHYFASIPWSAEFMAEYQACLDGVEAPKIRPGANRTKPGTFNALIATYLQSPEFIGLAPKTKPGYRSSIERFRLAHGDKRVATIDRRHIKAILAGMADRPAAANNLFDRLRTLMVLAVEEGYRRDNPMQGMKAPFKNKSDGYHTWTEEEIAAFEARHAPGSMPRLAMALMLYTGCRREDAVVLGPQHLECGRIRVRAQKTRRWTDIPVHPALGELLERASGDQLVFLRTSFGKPFSDKGFGNWFRDRCNEAGLPQCSAHGLRKAAARRMAEAGCTTHEIKAVTGHSTLAEVARYTEAANRAALADSGLEKVLKAKSRTKMANRPRLVSQNEE